MLKGGSIRLGEGLEACAVNVVGRKDCGERGKTVGPRRNQGLCLVWHKVGQTNQQLSLAYHGLASEGKE